MITPVTGSLEAFDMSAPASLQEHSTFHLGCELLARLREGSRISSYSDHQQQLAMLRALREAVDRQLDTHENRFSTKLLAGQFDFVRHCVRTHGLQLRGACHLEIGSGASSPFARMFTHLLAGAQRAWCLELDAIHDQAAAVRHLERIASDALLDPRRLFGDYEVQPADVLGSLASFDVSKLAAGDWSGLNRDRLEFLQRSVVDTGLPDASVDVVISNSVLEHLPDMDAALAELARVTKRGGHAIHGIDVSDHRRYGNPSVHPLEFLGIESKEPILFNCNRLRLCQHEELLAKHGFRVLERWVDSTITVQPAVRSRLVPPWSLMRDEQLDTLWGLYVVRRE